jgi:hypothetical protein
MSDAANVIVGSGQAYIAPKGTALPTLTTQPTESTWTSAGFIPFGYTDDGVMITYTPTYKDIDVDEEMAPIDKRLIAEKLEVTVKLAEATLLNLLTAIPGGTLTEGATTSTLTVGSPSDPDQGEFVLAFQGPAPGLEANAGTMGRVFVIYRVKNSSAVSHHAQRKDKVIYSVKFDALAQSANAAGNRLMEVIDYNPAGS